MNICVGVVQKRLNTYSQIQSFWHTTENLVLVYVETFLPLILLMLPLGLCQSIKQNVCVMYTIICGGSTTLVQQSVSAFKSSYQSNPASDTSHSHTHSLPLPLRLSHTHTTLASLCWGEVFVQRAVVCPPPSRCRSRAGGEGGLGGGVRPGGASHCRNTSLSQPGRQVGAAGGVFQRFRGCVEGFSPGFFRCIFVLIIRRVWAENDIVFSVILIW